MLQQEDGSWVDVRVLHSELKVGKDFTNWIKGRISKYEFIENDDWKLDSPNLANQKSHGGDRKSKHYSLTLDMAKELSMLENNKIGRITWNNNINTIRINSTIDIRYCGTWNSPDSGIVRSQYHKAKHVVVEWWR